MQVFKAFFMIARKRIKSISIYFGIYMFIIMMFTLTGNQSMEQNFQSSALRVVIQDEDHSMASEALCQYLESLHEVNTEKMKTEEIADMLYYRYLDYVLIIPQGFEERLIMGESDELLRNLTIPGSNVGIFVNHQITQYTKTVQLYLAGGYSTEEALKATNSNLESLPEVSLYASEKGAEAGNEYIYEFYRSLPYIMLLILFVGMAPIITKQNEKDIKARTLSSSLSATNRTLQLTLAGILFSMITWIAFMLLALVAFGGALFGENALLGMGNSFVFLIFAVVLTLFVSQFSPNENVVNMIANVIGLGTSFLCGVFVPQYMLSEGVLSIAKFLPAYWYISNNDMLAGSSDRLFDMSYYLQCIGIQLLFAAAFFAMTLSLSKVRKKA